MTSPPRKSPGQGGPAPETDDIRARITADFDRDQADPARCRDLIVLMHRSGHTEAALGLLARALARHPDDAHLWYSLGVISRAAGDLDAALRGFKTALGLTPDFAEAHFALGNLYRQAGRADKARRAYRAALDLRPGMVEALTNLGGLERWAGRWEASEQAFRQAAAAAPGSATAQFNLALACQAQGRTDEARLALQRADALAPSPALAFRRATLVPPIAGNRAEIDCTRARYAEELATLIDETPAGAITDPLKGCDWTNFYLAYHGADDRPLQELAARFFRKAAPSLSVDRVGRRRPGADDRRIRIGFASAYFRDHTIGALLEGVIAALDRARFQVTLAQIGAGDAVTRRLAGLADRFIPLAYDLDPARERLAEAKLDVLVYPEIGMDPATYFLAYSRLAPIQMVGWGHPVTTGLGTLDHFLSAQAFDRDDPAGDYTEAVAMLPRLLLNYRNPRLAAGSIDRDRLGFPADRTVYYCPQSLFKLHPDFDAALAAILAGDPDAEICLLQGHRPHWNRLLKARFAHSLGAHAARVRFIGNLSRTDFIAAFAHADVILDPPHFSGGKTSLEAFAMAAPVVTWPGRYLRGRLTAGFYRKMELTEAIADGAADFAARALALGRDGERRRAFSREIGARAGALFDDRASVRAFEALVLSLIESYDPGA